ncbi:hypothetical protein Hanom_Chr04g00312201 [Helianthus anomalus]
MLSQNYAFPLFARLSVQPLSLKNYFSSILQRQTILEYDVNSRGHSEWYKTELQT